MGRREQIRSKKREIMIRVKAFILILLMSVSAFATEIALQADMQDSVLLHVRFRVGLSQLDTTYLDNRQQLDRFVRQMQTLMATQNANLDACYVSSAASLEGGTALNQRLSESRSRAVACYLAQRLGLPASALTIHNFGEDWVSFRRLVMADAGLSASQRDTIIYIVDQLPVWGAAAVKRSLKTLEGGRLWQHFLEHQFVDMRCSTVRLLARYRSLTLSDTLPSVFTIQFKPFAQDLPQLPAPAPMVPRMSMPPMRPLPLARVQAPAPQAVKYPLLSVKTNVLYDLFYTGKTGFQPVVNFEVEWYTRGGRWSLLAEYEFPWWSNLEKKTFFQMQNWQLEPRYYFKNDHWFNGHYLSAYLMFNRYDFSLKGKDGSGYQGEGAGIGLGYGYVLPLGGYASRWKLEFLVKVGYYESHYDPYNAGYPFNGRYYYRWFDSPSKFLRRNHRFRYFGPSGAGVTLSYDLFRKKI